MKEGVAGQEEGGEHAIIALYQVQKACSNVMEKRTVWHSEHVKHIVGVAASGGRILARLLVRPSRGDETAGMHDVITEPRGC